MFGRSTAFFSELATNASLHNASIILFSGNDDSLVAPRSNEGTPQWSQQAASY